MVATEDRSADFIKEWIEPETEIISYYWKAYDRLSDEGIHRILLMQKLEITSVQSKSVT